MNKTNRSPEWATEESRVSKILNYTQPDFDSSEMKTPLEEIFERHYPDGSSALKRFREHLAEAKLSFDVEANINELQSPPQAGFPHGLHFDHENDHDSRLASALAGSRGGVNATLQQLKILTGFRHSAQGLYESSFFNGIQLQICCGSYCFSR